MRTLRVSDEVYDRMERIAVPLTDTVDSVLERLLDEHEVRRKAPSGDGPGQAMVFHCGDHGTDVFPEVRFTRFLRMTMANGLVEEATSWNSALRTILDSWCWSWTKGWAPHADDPVDYGRRVGVCIVEGIRTDNGFEPIGDRFDWSVQGLGAQKAGEALERVASDLGYGFEIDFRWRTRAGAKYPNALGRIVVERNEERVRELDRSGRNEREMLLLIERGAKRIGERGRWDPEQPTKGRNGVGIRLHGGTTLWCSPSIVAELGRSGNEAVLAEGHPGYDVYEALRLEREPEEALKALEQRRGRPELDGKVAMAIERGLREGVGVWEAQERQRAA